MVVLSHMRDLERDDVVNVYLLNPAWLLSAV